jgi:hypothetical protein
MQVWSGCTWSCARFTMNIGHWLCRTAQTACMVCVAWCMVHVVRCMVHVVRCMVHVVHCMVHGLCCMLRADVACCIQHVALYMYIAWCMLHAAWCTLHVALHGACRTLAVLLNPHPDMPRPPPLKPRYTRLRKRGSERTGSARDTAASAPPTCTTRSEADVGADSGTQASGLGAARRWVRLGATQVPVQIWQGVSPVPVQTWEG